MENVFHLFMVLFPALGTVCAALIWTAKVQLSNEFNKRITSLELENQAIHQQLQNVDSKQDDQIKTLVNWVMRSAENEAIRNGLITKNSPVHLTDKARTVYKPHSQAILDYYTSLPSGIDEEELRLAMMKQFGKLFEDTLCKDLEITDGACILVAIEIARELNESQYSTRTIAS